MLLDFPEAAQPANSNSGPQTELSESIVLMCRPACWNSKGLMRGSFKKEWLIVLQALGVPLQFAKKI